MRSNARTPGLLDRQTTRISIGVLTVVVLVAGVTGGAPLAESGVGSSADQPAPTRDQPPAAIGQPSVSRPLDGVYTYRTSGGGRTNALGGARHDYPAQVPVTVVHTDCGFTVRWQPLQERWDEWDFCLDGQSLRMNRISTYHEFFRRGLRQDFECGGTDVLGRRDVGARWEWSCRSGNAAVAATAVVVGQETLDVGGMSVDVLRVLNEATFTGANEGSQRFEWWLALETGLPLKMVRSVRTRSESPFGKVDYAEDAESVAESLAPQR